MHENEITGLIIGEAMKIHSAFGPGLLESVYEECLHYKLLKLGLSIERQKPIPLFFESIKMECGFRCDLIVEDKIIVEIKAIESLSEIHTAQLLTYLKLTDKKIGLLINFNVVKLKDGIKRLMNGYLD
jgi:GxxExxY protein